MIRVFKENRGGREREVSAEREPVPYLGSGCFQVVNLIEDRARLDGVKVRQVSHRDNRSKIRVEMAENWDVVVLLKNGEEISLRRLYEKGWEVDENLQLLPAAKIDFTSCLEIGLGLNINSEVKMIAKLVGDDKKTPDVNFVVCSREDERVDQIFAQLDYNWPPIEDVIGDGGLDGFAPFWIEL